MVDFLQELDSYRPIPPIGIDSEYDPYAETQESVEDEEEQFSIDTPEKANWGICKVKEAKQRLDMFLAAAQAQIDTTKRKMEKAEQQYQQDVGYLLKELDHFLDIAPAKKTKTQWSLELPEGKIVRKLPVQEFVRDEEKLVQFLQQNAPEKIKTETKVKWADLKKELLIQGDQVVWSQTGEVLDCIKAEERPGSIEVK